MPPSTTTFYYDSWPGWVIVGFRFLVLAFVGEAVRTTWLEENHPNKVRYKIDGYRCDGSLKASSSGNSTQCLVHLPVPG